MDVLHDPRLTRTLADVLQNPREHLLRLREEGAEVLTVDGQPELVLQSAEGYQELRDRLDYAESVAGLRKAHAQAREGGTRSLAEGLGAIRARHGL